MRHAAIGFGRELEKRDAGVTTKWWKEERGERIFVDFNQNNRDRTIASAYSLRPLPGAPVSMPTHLGRPGQVTDPGSSTSTRLPSVSPTVATRWSAINDVALRPAAADRPVRRLARG